MENLYYKVNRDLAIDIAKKAKEDGVKQFIFMSSIIVYGNSGRIGQKKVITLDTAPNSANFYGNSKLEAEKGIRSLEDKDFKVVVIRSPMVYGKDCKGNYAKLEKIVKWIHIFPDIDNERSMLHIDNLCEFVKVLIDNEESGLFFLQNKEYVKTTDMIRLIAEKQGKKIILTKVFNPILKLMSRKVSFLNKVFGNIVYDQSMSNYDKANYRIRDLKNSIIATED